MFAHNYEQGKGHGWSYVILQARRQTLDWGGGVRDEGSKLVDGGGDRLPYNGDLQVAYIRYRSSRSKLYI